MARHAARGRGGCRDPHVLSRHCAAASPLDWAMTTGRVIRRQSCLGLPGSCAGGAVVCGVPNLLSRGGDPVSPHFSKRLGSRISKPRPCAPSLALYRTGNKCLNFQIFPCIWKRHLSSPVHSIIINYLFSMMHFKLRSILSFIHRAMKGSF